jgi:predicted nucleotidyltransferase
VNRLESALRRVLKDLEEEGCGAAVVGGLAVSVRSEPRTTRDVDLAVAVDDDQGAEKVVYRLSGRGYRVMLPLEQEETGRLATVRMTPPGGVGETVVIDLLFASSGIEREIVERAESLEVFRGVRVPVARRADLIALKLLSRDDARRPQDRLDLHALLTRASSEELAITRADLALITERGFHRKRDLQAALAATLIEFHVS